MNATELLAHAQQLHQSGDLESAVQAYRDAIKLDPASPIGYSALGEIFAALNDLETSLVFFNAAAHLSPASPEAHNNLATIHVRRQDLALAADHLRRAATLSPHISDYPSHLGPILLALGYPDEAEATLRHALTLDPTHAEAHANLGFVLSQQLRLTESEQSYRQAIALKLDLAQAHVNLSHILLRRGAFAEGWQEHERRWEWNAFPSPRRTFPQPQWRGEPLANATIFLHAEQGFGDAIQFLRYIPLVAARGARILLEVHPELRQLAATLPGVTTLISRGDPIPPFDLHCPLMSLPLAFNTTVDTIPAATPYLIATRPTPSWVFQSRVTPSPRLKVGLVWAGSPKNINDRARSLTLEALGSLFALPGISFYSLQLGAPPSDLFAGFLPPGSDFADTAAAIAALDLVIAVDTAVAHLAGALNKPVWILLPTLPDWRWFLDRADSPWYPSARLFRQHHTNQWPPVIDQVKSALAQL